ncbi:MAG TPA: porin [Rhizomicrobium sp.]|nr:porin [Rhizomicrobium sp.]
MTGAALIALAAPALAQTQKPAQNPDPRIGALEQQLHDVEQQLAQIKQSQADSDTSAAVADLKRSTSDQYIDLNKTVSALPRSSIDNGRLQVTSNDGRFSAALRTLIQFDSGYYMQDHAANPMPAAYGNNFSSGSNFRRVYLNLQGRVFGDWSYNANFDFGGSGGTETPGHIQSVYLEYDGLAPWAFRIGAFPPPSSVEDATSAGDTIFLERNAPSDLQRNIAGGDGRDAVSILYATPTVYGALSFTGDKIQTGAKALAAAGASASSTFDEQEAVLGRLSWLPISEEHAHWLIGVNGTYVIKLPEAVAYGLPNLSNTPGATALNSFSFSDPPEFTFDSNGYTLANTGALNANHISQWGVETAGNWRSLYGQAGYYGFEVDRSQIAYATTSGAQVVQPRADHFSGWYLQGTWLLTGEERLYNPGTGAFTPPQVTTPLNFEKGTWGALELAARYSDLDLNDHINDTANVTIANATGAPAGTHTYDFYNTVRGGDQRILTLGLNWYPNTVVRFALNYELIQNSKLQSGSSPNPISGVTVATTGAAVPPTVNGGQNLSAVAIRAQLAL